MKKILNKFYCWWFTGLAHHYEMNQKTGEIYCYFCGNIHEI